MYSQMNQELIDKVKVWNNYEIGGFFGDYRWMSNFHPATIQINDMFYDEEGNDRYLDFPTNEHAFMYAKLIQPDHKYENYLKIVKLSPTKVKEWGRSIQLRADWEQIKKKVMFDVNWAKYTQHPDLAAKLLETGNKLLIERNYWGDTTWGIDHNKGGKNYLGKILMMVRDLLP
jgi:ribA/ribD-fused uncharacterized protein